MALEYVLYTSADLTPADFDAFLYAAIGGTRMDGYLRIGALDATALAEDPDDQAPIAGLLGFTNRLTVTFRLSNRAGAAETDEATVLMIRAVRAFFDRYPADGALLHDDSHVILERLAGAPTVIDLGWDDWTEIPGMADAVDGLERRVLAQPLH
jgi:hypothetical protein